MQSLNNSRDVPHSGARPERPPNHLLSAIIFLLVLQPISFGAGMLTLYGIWRALTGPAYVSEIPYWMTALVGVLKGVVAVIGFFMPIAAVVQSLRVNPAYNTGNYAGAISMSKSAASIGKQCILLLVLVVSILLTSLL